MTTVIALHGQAASGSRLRDDMGRPDWVDWFPDWQRDAADAEQFSDVLMDSLRTSQRKLVLIGYSLGGDFIARLTWQRIGDFIGGIVLYESPLLSLDWPRPVGCPVTIVWNDYVPKSIRRREEKAKSIANWSARFHKTQHLVGRHTSHVLYSWRPPFIRHAWDTTLNGLLYDWITNL